MGTVQAADERPLHRASAASCKKAVFDSRMLCLSGAYCVREISLILRSCGGKPGSPCAAARDELRESCGRESDWYGTRDCHKALERMGAHCAS